MRGGHRPGAGRKPDPSSKRQQRLRVVGGTDPRAPAEPRAAPRNVFEDPRAVQQVLRMSAAMARSRANMPELNPFRLAQHPPKARPPKRMQMAMDDGINWAANEWAGMDVAALEVEGLLFLGYPYLAELAQRPEYRTFAETIATEATRKWIKLKGTSHNRAKTQGKGGDKDRSERITQLTDEIDRLGLRDAMARASMTDSFFGRAHVFMDFGADLDTRSGELATAVGTGRDELSRSKVRKGSFQRVQNVEPVWVYPTTYETLNPLKPDWYSPQVWYVNGNREVHCSRLQTYVAKPVPDLLKPAYSFGGLSLSQLAKPYVDIWLRTRQSVGDLIHSFSVMVLSTDLQTILQPNNAAGLLARVALFNALRDNQGAFVINKNTEDFKNVSASLSGLHELQAQSQEHMMSVARIPAVKFTGIQPMGLNASSEGEMRAFNDTTKAYQQFFLRPNLTRAIDFAQLSLWGEVDDEITYDFESLVDMTEKERGEQRKAEAEAGKIYIEEGAISPEEERGRIIADPDSPYANLDPEDVPEPPEPEVGEEPEGDPDLEPDEEPEGAADEGVVPFADPLFAHDAEWEEGDHPRAPDGKFGAGSGSSTGGGEKTTGKAAPSTGPGMSGKSPDELKWLVSRSAEVLANPKSGAKARKEAKTIGPAAKAELASRSREEGRKYGEKLVAEAMGGKPALDPAGLKRVGERMGSNPGGVFEDGEGKRYYVKQGKTADHVRNEVTAAALYQLAGVPTLDYRPVKGGKHVATAMAKLDKDNAAKLSPAEVAQAQKDFAVHAWLANWDAVGTGGDNLGVVGGKATPLDLGGALEYRAQGAPKGQAFGEQVGELDAMRDPGKSPDAARVFKGMSPADQAAAVGRVADIPDAAIRRTVAESGSKPELADKLIARKRWMAKRAGLAAADQALDETDAHGHEHAPSGSPAGGQFVSQGGGGGSSESGGGGAKAEEKDKAKKTAFGGLWKAPKPGESESVNFNSNVASVVAKPANAGQSYRQMLAFMIKNVGKHGGGEMYLEPLKGHLISAWQKAHGKLIEEAAKLDPSKDMAQLAKLSAEEQKVAAKLKELGFPATAGAVAPELAKPAPKPAAAAKPKANLPKPTDAELAKAKKGTAIPASMFHAGAAAEVAAFNDKYQGKAITDPGELAQKVQDYKDLKAKSDAIATATQAEQQKAAAEAAEAAKEKQAKAAKAAAAAAKKQAEEAVAKNAAVMKDLGITASEAEGFNALVGMIGGKTADVVAAFKGYESKAAAHGYPITGFQSALISNYTDGGYRAINEALRSGSWTEAQHVYVKLVNKALQKMPTYAGKVGRGTSLPSGEQAKYKVGHVVEERAFTSTSITKPWSGNTKFTITAIGKRGAHVKKLSNYPGEDEVVYSARTFFKVTKVEGSPGGQMHVHMEEMEHHD